MAGIEGGALAALPSLHRDMVGDKTRNRAFEDGIVVKQYVLSIDSCFVVLTNN
jgi:hypothetical protein